MIFTLAFLAGNIIGPIYSLWQDAELTQRWVGQSFDQIEAALREKPVISMATGAIENPRLFRFYANARLMVWYMDGKVVKVHRTEK